MKYLLLFHLLTSALSAAPIRHELEIGGCHLTYYLEFPKKTGSYPLMVILEGSFVQKVGPRSILGLHAKLAQSLLDAGIAMATMERRGIDGDRVNVELFHDFNTPSQRLNDHIQLVEHLHAHHPQQWNGQLIVLGGSEDPDCYPNLV